MSDPTGANGPTQDQLLNATTPEALAALMAAEASPQPQEGVTAPAPAPAQADAAPAPAPAVESAAPGANSSEPMGVATKSGTGVLPFRVLQQERQERQHWRDQALTLQQQLEQANNRIQELQTAGTQQQRSDALAGLTDEEIAAAEADFPLLAKVARAIKSQPAPALAQPPAAAPAPAADPQDAADDTTAAVHAALSQHDMLASWQQRGGVVWGRAVELDNLLQADKDWAGRPMTDRFGEVQRRLAAELGIQAPAAHQPPAAAPTAPASAPEPAPFRPNTLSDLGGGAATQTDPLDASQDGMALARRFASMSSDQIAAAVRRSV